MFKYRGRKGISHGIDFAVIPDHSAMHQCSNGVSADQSRALAIGLERLGLGVPGGIVGRRGQAVPQHHHLAEVDDGAASDCGAWWWGGSRTRGDL